MNKMETQGHENKIGHFSKIGHFHRTNTTTEVVTFRGLTGGITGRLYSSAAPVNMLALHAPAAITTAFRQWILCLEVWTASMQPSTGELHCDSHKTEDQISGHSDDERNN